MLYGLSERLLPDVVDLDASFGARRAGSSSR